MARISDEEIEKITDKTMRELARGAVVLGFGRDPSENKTEEERIALWLTQFKDGHARLMCLRKWILQGKVTEVNTIKMDEQVFMVGNERFAWGHDVQFPPMVTFAHMCLSVQFNTNKGADDEAI